MGSLKIWPGGTSRIALAASPLLPYVGFFQAAALNTQVTGEGASGRASLVVPVGTSIADGALGISSNANNTFSTGFILNWNVPGLGVGVAGNVLAAKAQARKALVTLNQTLLDINEQVHSAYIDSLAARSEIDVANEEVRASAEEMRLADQRLKYQLGTNLELVQAERDYIQALTHRVEAITRYRKCQGACSTPLERFQSIV